MLRGKRLIQTTPRDGCTSNVFSSSLNRRAKSSGIGSIWPSSAPPATRMEKKMKRKRSLEKYVSGFFAAPPTSENSSRCYPSKPPVTMHFLCPMTKCFKTTNGDICYLGKSWLQKVCSCWGRCDGKGQAGKLCFPWNLLIGDSPHKDSETPLELLANTWAIENSRLGAFWVSPLPMFLHSWGPPQMFCCISPLSGLEWCWGFFLFFVLN